MANKGIASQLNHLHILKICQGIIEKYMKFKSSKKKPIPSALDTSKMSYAVDMYKKSIPQTQKFEDGKGNAVTPLLLIRYSFEDKDKTKNG